MRVTDPSTWSIAKNLLAKILRPVVRHWRDIQRVRKIGEDISRVLPHLAKARFAKGSYALDLGANRGDFSVWCLEHGMNVVAIEPHPDAFSYLVNRTKKSRNILRLQVAASSTNKTSSILVHPQASQDQLGFSIRSTIKFEKRGFVPYAICLELNFLEILESLGEVKVLKVDIEGSESEIWPIIKSHKNKIEFLLMEIHDQIHPNLREEIDKFIEINELESRWTTKWV